MYVKQFKAKQTKVQMLVKSRSTIDTLVSEAEQQQISGKRPLHQYPKTGQACLHFGPTNTTIYGMGMEKSAAAKLATSYSHEI